MRAIYKRRLMHLLLASLLAIGWVASINPIASAAGGIVNQFKCTASSLNGTEVCVTIYGPIGGPSVYGEMKDYVTSYGAPIQGTVYVVQCDGQGHGCGTIASKSAPPATFAIKNDAYGNFYQLQPTPKPHSFGHVYKACASETDSQGRHFVNLCTDLLALN